MSAGLTLLPLLIVQIAVSALSGFFVSKTGRFRVCPGPFPAKMGNLNAGTLQPPLICGYTIWAVSNGLVSTFDQSTTVAKSVGYLILQGIGAGMTFQTRCVSPRDRHERASDECLRVQPRGRTGSCGKEGYGGRHLDSQLHSDAFGHTGAGDLLFYHVSRFALPSRPPR